MIDGDSRRPADEAPSLERRLAEEAYCWSLARLVFVGARALLNLRQQSEDGVDFASWRDLVLREAPELAGRLRSAQGQLPFFDLDAADEPRLVWEHLSWLWEALDRDPFLRSVPRLDPTSPIEVLPPGSVFYFDLQGCVPFEIHAYIVEPLKMHTGKLGRLECCSVRTLLVRQRRSDAPLDHEAEARFFDVPTDRVSAEGDSVVVEVASLNEAYTRASIRCERHRRSHTGNVFQKVFWLPPGKPPPGLVVENHQGKELVRLKHIRDAVGSGRWPLSLMPGEGQSQR